MEYIIIASFSSQSYTRACIPGPDPQNFLQNGSFAVDHFSTLGAKVTTDFLEQYVLVNGVKELMEEVGNYGDIPLFLAMLSDLSKSITIQCN